MTHFIRTIGEVIPAHPDDFLYLDPPYPGISEIYFGHTGLDHARLAAQLRGRERWIMSNQDCEHVRDLYSGCHIEPVHWSYSVSTARDTATKPSSEVLILSADVARQRLSLGMN